MLYVAVIGFVRLRAKHHHKVCFLFLVSLGIVNERYKLSCYGAIIQFISVEKIQW
jgi:hypothetical protein